MVRAVAVASGKGNDKTVLFSVDVINGAVYINHTV